MEDKIDIVVAKKIDDYQIVINKGTVNDIDTYMRFLVYEEGEIIIDPTNNEVLGNLELPKGFFKVQHIQEKLTILASEVKREKENPFIPMFQREVDVERDLLSRIKVGDKVKIVNILK